MYLRSTPIPLLAQHPLRLRIQVNLIITQPCLVSSSTVHIHANSVWRYHPANPAPTAPHTHPNPIVCSKQNDPEHIWFHGCRKDLRSHCQMRCTMDRYEDHRGIIFCSAMFCVFRSAVTLHVSDEKSIALSTVIFKAFKVLAYFVSCVMRLFLQKAYAVFTSQPCRQLGTGADSCQGWQSTGASKLDESQVLSKNDLIQSLWHTSGYRCHSEVCMPSEILLAFLTSI